MRTLGLKQLTALCVTVVCLQEDEWDALHRHQAVFGHHDEFRLSVLLPVPPAALLHGGEDGEGMLQNKHHSSAIPGL